MDAIATKADGKNKAGKEAAKGAPTKVVPGAGKELPRLEQGVVRTQNVVATGVDSASLMRCLLWRSTATWDSSEPPARAIVEVIMEAVLFDQISHQH